MKIEEPKRIGEILSEYLKAPSLALASTEGSIRETWHQVAGDYIYSATNDAFIKNGILTLGFTNSTVKAQIHMNKKYYISQINKTLGLNLVHSIRII